MLKRISNANEEIVEILLSKNKVLSALRYLASHIKSCFALKSINERLSATGSLGIQFRLKAYQLASFSKRLKTLRIPPYFMVSTSTFNNATGAFVEVQHF
jgi:hypothetical protein